MDDNLLEYGKQYVRNMFGEKAVADFERDFKALRDGTPIGGFVDTARFLDLLDKIRDEMERNGQSI